MDAIQPLAGERQEKESNKAVAACNDWLRMGPGRSIPALIEKYEELLKENPQFKPPTLKKGTMGTWSSYFDWPARAIAYDAAWEERQNAERERVFREGLALDYERVKRLRRIAEMLEEKIFATNEAGIYENHKIYTQGGYARFNAALFDEFRATLNDIASETGGRIKKSEVTGKDGGPIQHNHEHHYPDIADDTLDDIFGNDPAGEGSGSLPPSLSGSDDL